MKIMLFKTWSEDNIAPCEWDDNCKNYCAVVRLKEDGEEERTYLKLSGDSDLFFQFRMDVVKAGDIIKASCWRFKRSYKTQKKSYYIVKEITSEYVELSDAFTTYRKAFKSLNNQKPT